MRYGKVEPQSDVPMSQNDITGIASDDRIASHIWGYRYW